MRPIIRHVRAALASLDELEWALYIVTFAGLHYRYLLPFADEFLEVQLFQRRLWIKRINVRRSTFHHEKYNILCLRLRKMDLLRCKRMFLRFLGKQRAECDTAKACAQAVNELTASWRMQSSETSTGKEGFNGHI